ncbi:MAG: hypothetical protein AAGK23_06255 [Pseudomonadota bacterium]
MRILVSAIVLALASGPLATAQDVADFQIEKGVVVASDFGDRLGRSELRDGLRERGVEVRKFFNNLGNTFLVSDAKFEGQTYRLKVDRNTGEITWFSTADRPPALF